MKFHRAGLTMVLLLMVLLVLAGCGVDDAMYADEDGWKKMDTPKPT